MHPTLFQAPVVLAALLAGAIIGASLAASARRSLTLLAGLAGAILGGVAAYLLCGPANLPVRGYGVMILLGFLCGVWMAARRSKQIGVAPAHCMDVGVYGVVLGLAAARLFYVIENWSFYNPFQAYGFALGRFLSIFKLWEGGLVFFGAFLAIIPFAWIYCRLHKLPPLPFLDLAIPSVIAGQAFGRIGCFLYGCCYGKVCELPWAVRFPSSSPAYEWQVSSRLLPSGSPASLPVHPTQLYAALAAALTAGFLYSYWPRRRFDGEVFAYALLMAGGMRFLEELLRTDEPAAFPWLAQSLTIAQWIGALLFFLGAGLWWYFKRKGGRLSGAHSLGHPGDVKDDLV
jgi:phosphatidylglycerol:prolipoprotein diacylglycerol transferase